MGILPCSRLISLSVGLYIITHQLSEFRKLFVPYSLFRYFTTLFFSIIATATTDCVTDEGFSYFLEEILSFMQRFLREYTYEEVREAEKMTGFFWTTYKPFVNLIYFNYEQHLDSDLVKEKPLVKDLYLTSICAGIFSLKNMCLSDQMQDILEKEKLTDFLLCLPWYVPNDLKVDARMMVQLMSEKVKPNPPMLMNIVKARLATLYMPLDEVMSPSFTDKIHHRLYELSN